MMKQVRIYVAMAVVAVCLLIPLVSDAAPRAEIRITNDTRSQVTFFITTGKFGRVNWTYRPGNSSFPTSNGARVRVKGDDTIEIADWGRTYIDRVAVFNDREGIWELSLRDARRQIR